MGRYRGRHRAADGGTPIADVTAKVLFDCPRVTMDPDEHAEMQARLTASVHRYLSEAPTRPTPASSIRQGLISAEPTEIPESPWVFEGAAAPPYIGTHIAMHCPACGHTAWTYRNTPEGWAELRARINDHKQVHAVNPKERQ